MNMVSPRTAYVPECEPLVTLMVWFCLYCPEAKVRVWVPHFWSLISSWSSNRGLAASSPC